MQSYRQGVAGSRHAETILASSQVLSPDGVGNADGVPTIVDCWIAAAEADSSVAAAAIE